MPIAASQLPEVRNGLRRYIGAHDGNLVGQIISMHVSKGGTYELPYPESGAPSWRQAMAGYQARLRSMVDTVELFHVSAEMTVLAAHAGLTMPGYRLHRDELPAESGLVVFDSPIGVATHDDIAADPHNDSDLLNLAIVEAAGTKLETVSVIAAMWRLAITHKEEPGVLVTLWTANSDHAAYWESIGKPETAATFRRMGHLNYHDETVLPFGEWVDGGTTDPDNPKPIKHDALRTLIATWLIMGQDLVTVEPEPLPRQMRRRFIRDNGEEPPLVRVVKLRRPKTRRADTDSESGRKLHYRHPRRGHWRQQWYPSRNDHRPKYIPDLMIGDESLPLMPGARVFDLRK